MQKNILVEDLGSQLTSFFTDECLPDSSEFPIPSIVLVTGGIGSGKTTLVREVVTGLGIPYLFVNCASLILTTIGESEQNLKRIMEFPYGVSQSIMVFDNLEILLPVEHAITSLTQCRLSSLFLDQVKTMQYNKRKCTIIGIVGRDQLSQLDPQVGYPDIVRKVIQIPKLSKSHRVKLLKQFIPPTADDSFLTHITNSTETFSLADLHAFCRFCIQNPKMESILTYVSQQHGSHTRQFRTVQSLVGGMDSLIGMSQLKEKVRENVIVPLLHWDQYAKYNLQPPSGCLFFGPSGCGKTAMLQAIASELQNRVEMIEVTCTDLLSKYLGDSEKKLHALFTQARQCSPSILVFDHIEVITGIRGNDSSEEKTMDRLLSCLLTEMDGIHENKDEKVFLIGVTSQKEGIDSSVLRSGRLECHIEFVPPTPEERRIMILDMLQGLHFTSEAEQKEIIEWFVNKTSFRTFADVKGLLDDVVMKYISRNWSCLTKAHLANFWLVCMIYPYYNGSVFLEGYVDGTFFIINGIQDGSFFIIHNVPNGIHRIDSIGFGTLQINIQNNYG